MFTTFIGNTRVSICKVIRPSHLETSVVECSCLNIAGFVVSTGVVIVNCGTDGRGIDVLYCTDEILPLF